EGHLDAELSHPLPHELREGSVNTHRGQSEDEKSNESSEPRYEPLSGERVSHEPTHVSDVEHGNRRIHLQKVVPERRNGAVGVRPRIDENPKAVAWNQLAKRTVDLQLLPSRSEGVRNETGISDNADDVPLASRAVRKRLANQRGDVTRDPSCGAFTEH